MQKRQAFGPVSFISWIINAVILTEYCFIYYTLHRAQGGEIRGLHLTQKCLCWINITLIYLTKCHKITKMFHNFSRNIHRIFLCILYAQHCNLQIQGVLWNRYQTNNSQIPHKIKYHRNRRVDFLHSSCRLNISIIH